MSDKSTKTLINEYSDLKNWVASYNTTKFYDYGKCLATKLGVNGGV